jgi:hypothetical protein
MYMTFYLHVQHFPQTIHMPIIFNINSIFVPSFSGLGLTIMEVKGVNVMLNNTKFVWGMKSELKPLFDFISRLILLCSMDNWLNFNTCMSLTLGILTSLLMFLNLIMDGWLFMDWWDPHPWNPNLHVSF